MSTEPFPTDKAIHALAQKLITAGNNEPESLLAQAVLNYGLAYQAGLQPLYGSYKDADHQGAIMTNTGLIALVEVNCRAWYHLTPGIKETCIWTPLADIIFPMIGFKKPG